MRRLALVAAALLAVGSRPEAQVPQPFPRPGQSQQAPARPAPQAPAPEVQPPAAEPPAAVPEGEPTEASLGFPLYPNAQFITSYDAGRGQRYYLFGSDAQFAVLVKYYQGVLKTRGNLVFDAPATQIFEIGRFDDRTMAYPPGVTIKDYTWNGSPGYLNPKKDAAPERFASIIQIVPAPLAAPRR